MPSKNRSLMNRLYHLGVRQGQRIAIQSRNCPQFAELVCACWQLGVVVVPVSARYPDGKVAELLDDLNVKHFFVSREFCSIQTKSYLIEEFIDSDNSSWTPTAIDKTCSDLQADASVILTSGSTAKPKAVLHTLENHYYSAAGSCQNIPFGQGDKWLVSLPMYHISGFSLIMRAMLHGGTLIFQEPNQPLSISLQRGDITHLSLVPFQLIGLLEDSESVYRLKQTRAILLGGASVPLNLIKKAISLELPIYRTYGSTEMASQVATTGSEDRGVLSLSAGRPLEHREVKVDCDGQILVRGPVLFKRYACENQVRAGIDEEGYFATGDMGYFDDDGHLHITGRKDLMFISGGENIHPEEVEQAISALESVEQVLVVPVKHPHFGSRPVAFIKTCPGMCFDPESAKLALKETLESFKIPDHFFNWPEELCSTLKPPRSEFIACAEKKACLKSPPEHL